MIKDIRDRLADQLRPQTDLRKAFKRLRSEVEAERREGSNPAPAVSDDTTRSEFARRYAYLQWSILIVAIFFLLSLIQLIVSTTAAAALISGLLCVLSLLMATARAYRAWLARYVWRNWDKRREIVLPSLTSFMDEVGTDPREFLPARLGPAASNSPSAERTKRDASNGE